MLDLVSSLILVAMVAIVGLIYGAAALAKSRMHTARLDGHGGVLLGRGLMEATYAMMKPVVWLLLKLRITPNMVTGFSLFPALASAVALATGHFGFGALLATASAFCDMLDGILARELKTGSDAGELFDAAVDRYVEFFLLAGLVVYFRSAPVIQVIVLGALVGSFMVSYTTAKAEALHVPPPKGAMRRAERAVYLLAGCMMVPIAARVLAPSKPRALVPLGPEVTIEAAMFIVAAVTNVSSVRRLRRIAQSVRARDQVV
jgi:phosphatidylglycerophosphate synthase